MPVDIRATVACSLGTVISGNVSDDYVQGTGLIKCSGSVVISGIITPAIGTAVTFSYTKSGVTRSIPRKLRVLSSFADPFRRTTSVELGCKLTYLQDKRDSIDWTAFDDDENTLTEEDAKIITIPIRAQAVAKKCMDELGITGTFTLTNQFSVAEFDLSPGYVQVLSDLLVSESLCGYLDANETLQVFSLDQAGGTGPVLDATQLVDIGKIGSGQLPGEAVVVSYSSLKLKREVDQIGGGGSGGSEATAWTRSESSNVSGVIIAWTDPVTGNSRNTVFNVPESTITITTYGRIRTRDGQLQRLPFQRVTTLTTLTPAVMGSLFSAYYSNGISISSSTVQKVTTETFTYDDNGREIFADKRERGGIAFLFGGTSIPVAFSSTDFVTFTPSLFIDLGRETRSTVYVNRSSQVITRTFGHWYRTIPGQLAINEGRISFNNAAQVSNYVNALVEIGLLELSTTVDLQATGVVVSAPTEAEVNNAANAKGGDPNNGYRTESKAELTLALGSATAQRRIELSLPYAPDDVFRKVSSTYSSIESDAPQKAQLYGRVQNRLLLGNRNGMSIQAAPEVLPAAPFTPFVVKFGSTSALYRTNGTNWTFDAQGLVVSTDALFWGGVGGNAGESWFPIAPGITTLPTTPGTTTVNITDGSGNVVGSYQQMVVPGTVPLAQETALLQATLRVRPVVTLLPYALQVTAQVAFTVKSRFSVTATLVDPYNRLIIDGTATPVLGAGQVSPTTAATNNGWQLIYNSAADEGATQTGSFGFNFTLNNVAYTTCYVNSNGYLTFGGTENQYLNLGAAVPNLPKLHVGSGDFSYQRVYTKVGTDEFRIRWEGNASYQAGAGNSNRFHEVTFFSPNANGSQWLEVRTGNVAGSVTGPLMLATATTALATGTFAANQSWVFQGNGAGTTWTVASGKHVQPPLAVVITAPAATLTIAALAPEVATTTVVDVPAAVVTLIGLAPVVATTALVDVPLVSIALTGLAPTVSTTASASNYWSDWVLQNYGWDSDLYPDWWAD